MKIAVSLLVLVLVVSISASPSSRTKRGFRLGAADRFSHGFGKRGEGNLVGSLGDESVMTAAELAQMLQERPQLIHSFVRKYVDTDANGVVTRNELFSDLNERR